MFIRSAKCCDSLYSSSENRTLTLAACIRSYCHIPPFPLLRMMLFCTHTHGRILIFFIGNSSLFSARTFVVLNLHASTWLSSLDDPPTTRVA